MNKEDLGAEIENSMAATSTVIAKILPPPKPTSTCAFVPDAKIRRSLAKAVCGTADAVDQVASIKKRKVDAGPETATSQSLKTITANDLKEDLGAEIEKPATSTFIAEMLQTPKPRHLTMHHSKTGPAEPVFLAASNVVDNPATPSDKQNRKRPRFERIDKGHPHREIRNCSINGETKTPIKTVMVLNKKVYPEDFLLLLNQNT